MDAKVGGTFSMCSTNFPTGHSHSFGGESIEPVLNERIRYTDKFDDPNLPGEMQAPVICKSSCHGGFHGTVDQGRRWGRRGLCRSFCRARYFMLFLL
jgi:hypothetical protein